MEKMKRPLSAVVGCIAWKFGWIGWKSQRVKAAATLIESETAAVQNWRCAGMWLACISDLSSFFASPASEGGKKKSPGLIRKQCAVCDPPHLLKSTPVFRSGFYREVCRQGVEGLVKGMCLALLLRMSFFPA